MHLHVHLYVENSPQTQHTHKAASKRYLLVRLQNIDVVMATSETSFLFKLVNDWSALLVIRLDLGLTEVHFSNLCQLHFP